MHKRFYKNYYVNQKETQSSGTVTDEEDQAASSGGGGANGGSSSSNKGNNDENENEDEDDDLESLFRVIDITQYKVHFIHMYTYLCVFLAKENHIIPQNILL